MMRMMFRAIGAALVAGVLTGSAMAAEVDPIGRWQTTSGESKYDFAYCGTDGSRLCGRLVWLNDYGMTTPAKDELGHYAVTEAVHAAPNVWKGPLSYQGKTANATLAFTGPKTMTISGCYLVFCKAFDLVRVDK